MYKSRYTVSVKTWLDDANKSFFGGSLLCRDSRHSHSHIETALPQPAFNRTSGTITGSEKGMGIALTSTEEGM